MASQGIPGEDAHEPLGTVEHGIQSPVRVRWARRELGLTVEEDNYYQRFFVPGGLTSKDHRLGTASCPYVANSQS